MLELIGKKGVLVMSNSFYNRLTALRQDKRISQNELAKKTGLTRQAISLYETGKREPNLAVINRLADFFNVSVDYLLGRTDDPHNAEKKVIKEKTADLNDDETIFTYEGKEIPPEDLEYMKRILRGGKE